ncbi:MAG: ATP-binding protein [Actinomycetota bacterium]|nr:ATP-binding protein [Actinomycetota bacterium]
MEFDRKLAGILTMLAIAGIPSTVLIVHLPHGQEIDYSVVYISLVALVILITVFNMVIYYPSKHGKMFPRVPPYFIGVMLLYFILCVGVFFSGGLESPLYYPLLLGPLLAGMSFELPMALTSTSTLTILYLLVIVAHSPVLKEDSQALAFNILYLFLACLLSNRLALELRRQERSKDEVANLGDFIRRLEKAKSEFVSMVSHELRTPLTSIHGFSEILRTKDMEPEKKMEFYRIILNESERLSRLITNLLNLSKIEAGIELNREMVDLGDLVEEDLEFFQSQTDIHELEYQGSREIPHIYCDPDRVHQIIKNLMANAIKYSPEGGSVEVATGVEGKYVTISITDHGIGVPAQELPHIFERFRRVERKEIAGITGTGLGLAIVKHLVELHGGQIRVESEPGEGSTFTVFLPIRGV